MIAPSGPELIVSRGKIYSGAGDPVRLGALAVEAGKIIAVGDPDEIDPVHLSRGRCSYAWLQ